MNFEIPESAAPGMYDATLEFWSGTLGASTEVSTQTRPNHITLELPPPPSFVAYDAISQKVRLGEYVQLRVHDPREHVLPVRDPGGQAAALWHQPSPEPAG